MSSKGGMPKVVGLGNPEDLAVEEAAVVRFAAKQLLEAVNGYGRRLALDKRVGPEAHKECMKLLVSAEWFVEASRDLETDAKMRRRELRGKP